jgi:hypothetical protein
VTTLVSNDDILIPVAHKLELKYLEQYNASASIHQYTVPANKRWVLRAGNVATPNPHFLELSVLPSGGGQSTLINGAGLTQMIYKPSIDLRLPPGTKIQFEMDVAAVLSTNILYEEEDEY